MLPELSDTIVALSTAAGAGARAVVRLSGDRALAIVQQLAGRPVPMEHHHWQPVVLRLGEANRVYEMPAEVYGWTDGRSYTGQDVVELHLLSSPPLVEAVVAECLRHGARAAQAGEFTMRAFLAGKLDLTRVEAVLAVIEANAAGDLKQALGLLAGGVSQPLQRLRDDLLNLLADLEAGLDFADEDIQFVSQDDLLRRLSAALAHLTLVRKQLDERAMPERPFRAVLAGRPNAGKSSLFNALAGQSAAIVSNVAGTTRDYLICKLNIDGVAIEIVDTAGIEETRRNGAGVDAPLARGQQLGQEQASQADLVIWCHEAGTPPPPTTAREVIVATKCDLTLPHTNAAVLATSSSTGAGLEQLRKLLADRARAQFRSALTPSLSRCRHHVDACLGSLRRAHMAALCSDPPELLAAELRGALHELGEMVGAVYTDDLLDRIFSRFCIGK